MYSVNERIISKYEADGGMKTGRETIGVGENMPYFHFVHHKSHMTELGTGYGPSWWGADY
jgi:hypothetical protein